MFIILKLIESIAGLIPYSLLLKIGSCIGLLEFYLDNKHRRLAIANIIKGLKLTSVKGNSIAKKSFQNFGKNIVSFLRDDSKIFQAVGREHISKDRGNIFVIGHFGNWEELGRIAVESGIQLTAVGRAIKNKGVDKYIKTKRSFAGLTILDKKGSFKYLLTALKEEKSVGILIDQYAGRRGTFVDFLGIPTSTISSPVLLAMRTGCPIVPVVILSEDKIQKIFIEQPIHITKTGDIAKDIQVNTQSIVKPLEKYVRMYPEQWWWVHRRWR